MVHDPIFLAIGAFRETGVANAVRLLLGILGENTAFGVLFPSRRTHRVVTNQLKLP